MNQVTIPEGIQRSLTYKCPKCGQPIAFDYIVLNTDIIWNDHKGQIIRFQDSFCPECDSEYVLPIKIRTKVKVEIDGYMTKAEHDSMYT